MLSACGNTDSTGQWSNAELVLANISYPQISVKTGTDGKGNTLAVYNQPDGIYALFFTTHSGLSTPQKIADNPEQYVSFNKLHLAVNDRGDAIAAWVHDQIGNTYIQTVRYTFGSGWERPRQLPTPNLVFSLDIALDADGNSAIAWEGWDASDVQRHIFASRSLSASEWEAPVLVSTSIWNAQYPRIAMDNTGNAFVLWVEGQFYTSSVNVSRYATNSGWRPPQLIASNSGPAAWTNIAFDDDGNAMALWGQSDGTGHDHIYSCRYAAGTGWGSSVVVDSNTLDSIEPALTLGTNGSFLAIWVQLNGTGSDIYSSRHDAASGWETPRMAGAGGNARSPHIAADGAGNVFVAWQQYDPNDIYSGDANVYVNRFTDESGWRRQKQLKNTLGGAGVPEISVDSNGHATAVWLQSVASPPATMLYGMFYSRFQ